MKLDTIADITETNCTLESHMFNIKASPIAFDILSNKLYSNNILAIVRELLTNAYDAHVKAGTTDIPIMVTLPTYTESIFSIRDFGTGLSKEEIKTIYTTFFSSTKNDSNDFTGCFGLGSKTPFSYTNSFTIKSYYNGMEYVCSALKKDGYPNIIFLSEIETDEPNGLEVIIPIANIRDGQNFIAELKQYIRYIPEIKLDITNSDIKVEEPILTFDNIKIYNSHSSSSYEHRFIIKQGQNVFNNFSLNNILAESRDINFVRNLLLSTIVVYEVPLGTLGITPNREQLIINEETNRLVSSFITNTRKTILKYVTLETFPKYSQYRFFRELLGTLINNRYFLQPDIIESCSHTQVFINSSYWMDRIGISTGCGGSNVTSRRRLSSLKFNTNYLVLTNFNPRKKTIINKLNKIYKSIGINEDNYIFIDCFDTFYENSIDPYSYSKYASLKEAAKAYGKLFNEIKDFFYTLENIPELPGITFTYIDINRYLKITKLPKITVPSEIAPIVDFGTMKVRSIVNEFTKIKHYSNDKYQFDPYIFEGTPNNIIIERNTEHFAELDPANTVRLDMDEHISISLILILALLCLKDINGKMFASDYFKDKLDIDIEHIEKLRFFSVYKTNIKKVAKFPYLNVEDFFAYCEEAKWVFYKTPICDIISPERVYEIYNNVFGWKIANHVMRTKFIHKYKQYYKLFDKYNATLPYSILNSNKFNVLSKHIDGVVKGFSAKHTTKAFNWNNPALQDIKDFLFILNRGNKYKWYNSHQQMDVYHNKYQLLNFIGEREYVLLQKQRQFNCNLY